MEIKNNNLKKKSLHYSIIMKVSIRHFPSAKEGRRASFISLEITLNVKNPTLNDLFKQYTKISPSTHKVARGVTYLNLEELLIEGEILNIISI
jgi:hypothetical protein